MTLGHTLLVLALYVLVAARITRLVNYDTVADPFRLWVARRASTAHALADTVTDDVALEAKYLTRYRRWAAFSDFIGCPWCVGMWVAVALAPAAIVVLGWPWWTWLVLPFAASHLIGIGNRWVSEDLEIVEAE